MLVISITADAHTQCVFSFGGRDLGRGNSLSVPVSLLRSRESSHNRPFLMESVSVELVCGGRSQAQLRLPLSDLYPGPRSEAKYYKTSSSSEADAYVIGRGYVYAEMVLQGCESLAPLMSPRMQLCQLLPPSAHEYRHLYVGAGPASSPHDSLAGMLLLLPGPRVGEMVLDMREGVEWRPLTLGNAFGDRFPLVCRGVLLLTDLRLLFVPREVQQPPWVDAPAAGAELTEASLCVLRKATWQAPLGAVQDVRVAALADLSQGCSLQVETREGLLFDFLVRKGAQGSAGGGLGALYLAGLDSERVAPPVWCARFQESALGLVREDRSWVLWAAYLRQTVEADPLQQQQQQQLQHKQQQHLSLEADYQRLRVCEGGQWRLCFNDGYSLCASYPQTLCLPGALDEDETQAAASQRSKGRLGCLVWLHPHSKAPLCRAAQPMAGMSGFDTKADRKACLAIRAACPSGLPLRIADARPRLNANANALQGKGFESVSALGGPGVASLVFLDIENIHEMRRSLAKLREAIVPSPGAAAGAGTGLAGAEAAEAEAVATSKWLAHVASLLRASSCIAESLTAGHPVLTHCSDGWDRTSQISAVSQLLLDPHYRTAEGFFSLVHKDWCAFGHHFENRCNGRSGHKESSPVFLQFLDCVFQVTQQHPSSCEFSPALLLLLAQASASGAFSTFRADSERERFLVLKRAAALEELRAEDAACSSAFAYLQALLRGPSAALLFNPHYVAPPPAQRLCLYLRPRTGPQDMMLWRAGLCGCFPPGIGAAGIEGITAAESVAHALRAGATVGAYLSGLGPSGGGDPTVQRRVAALLEQSLPRLPSCLEAPVLATQLAVPPRRPLPPRFVVSSAPSCLLRAVCCLQIWARARLQSRRALHLLAPAAAQAPFRSFLLRLLFALARSELQAVHWARLLASQASVRFVRRDVLAAVVEAALDQCLRTEHAQGFLDGPALQAALALGGDEDARRSSGEPPSSLLGRMRRLAGGDSSSTGIGGSTSSSWSGSSSSAPPILLVPPVTASSLLLSPGGPLSPPGPPSPGSSVDAPGGSSSPPGGRASSERGPKESVLRGVLNYVQGL